MYSHFPQDDEYTYTFTRKTRKTTPPPPTIFPSEFSWPWAGCKHRAMRRPWKCLDEICSKPLLSSCVPALFRRKLGRKIILGGVALLVVVYRTSRLINKANSPTGSRACVQWQQSRYLSSNGATAPSRPHILPTNDVPSRRSYTRPADGCWDADRRALCQAAKAVEAGVVLRS